MLASGVYAGHFGHVLSTERSFFGVYRISNDDANGLRTLFHGSTVHGIQSLDPARACEPLAYYTRSGPIGQVFAAYAGEAVENQVAIVGLGAGALAAYQTPGGQFTFYEIDPLVERIARDPRYFTYLSNCAPQARVVLGDARLSLDEAPDHAYGIIVLDASAAIPFQCISSRVRPCEFTSANSPPAACWRFTSVTATWIFTRSLATWPTTLDWCVS